MKGRKGIWCCIRGILWGLLPLALILILAWVIARPGMEERLRAAVLERLKSAGQEWASASFEGRDARLSGEAPSRTALVDAARNALAVRGVRRVDVSGVRTRLEAPVVNRVSFSRPPLIVTGRWPERSGAGLVVELMGRTYELGRSPELVSDGRGNWKLTLKALPPDGVYDVTAMTVDGSRRVADATANELLVDTTPPAAPEIGSAAIEGRKVILTGTWPEGDAKRLLVTVGDRTYELGRDNALRSDGEGHWRLEIPEGLPEGSHDVTVMVADALGNSTETGRKGVFTLDFTPPARPTITRAGIEGGRVVIEGGWPGGDARKLRVTVDGRTYELGKSPELVVKGGRWKLVLYDLPSQGAHDVAVVAEDAAGNRARTVGKGVLVVDTVAPEIGSLKSVDLLEDGRVRIRGTWREEKGARLTADFAGRTYVAGRDGEFVTDGRGGWELAPETPLKPGSYDLRLESVDAAGNRAYREFPAVVIVPAPEPEAPPVPAVSGGNEKGAAGSSGAVETGKAGQMAAGVRHAGKDDTGAGTGATEKSEVGGKPVDTTPPAAPTVVMMKTRKRQPRITGSWPADDAVMLEVELDGRKYRKGMEPVLKVDGNSWSLTPDHPLSDGYHDVKVVVTDAAGNRSVDTSRNEIYVDATSPGTPTVQPVSTIAGTRLVIRGTWPEGDARDLTVEIAGKTHVLGARDGLLRRDGRGRWRLDLPGGLPPGSYDVRVTAVDELGNRSTDQTKNEVLVRKQPEVLSPGKAEGMMRKSDLACQRNLDGLLERSTIHFESDSARIRPESMKVLEELARILNTCPKTRVLIAGHTDATGSATYNQSLSERRAAAVGRALVRLGVSASRFSAVGYGESRPIADNATEEGRARNRRIEFIITPEK